MALYWMGIIVFTFFVGGAWMSTFYHETSS